MKVISNELKENTLVEGVRARFFSGERMMFSLVKIDAGIVLPRHSHPHEQMGYVLKGSLLLRGSAEEAELKVGDMYVMPGGESHEAVGGKEGTLILDVFAPPREEYLEMAE